MPEPLTIQLKTLTPLWTGGVDQTCDRLHETGLIGSLRWWYEALVRGLGGYACDPTDNSSCRDADHCAACELFGCTGWSRKFCLRVTENGAALAKCLDQASRQFTLLFCEIRPLCAAERWLLANTVRVAANWGSIGGRTTRKPQRNASVGRDYGLMSWVDGPQDDSAKDAVKGYLAGLQRGNHVQGQEWPDLRWFFFIKGRFLLRLKINNLTGLSENGKKEIGNEPYQRFLRGQRGQPNQDAKSKRVFSFRTGGGRIWGYARDAKMREQIIRQLRRELGTNINIKTGEGVIHEL